MDISSVSSGLAAMAIKRRLADGGELKIASTEQEVVMPEITIEVEAKLLPQLVVISAITEGPGGNGPYIENHCCMVRDTAELAAEVDTWRVGIESDGGRIVKVVVRHVPKKVYALATLRRSVPDSADTERWVIGEPGGPSGPFYSVVTQTGQMVAMQVTDKWFAYLISQIPQFLHRRRRWASLIKRLATLVISGERSSDNIDEANKAIAEVLPFIEE